MAMRSFARDYANDIRAIDPGIGIMKLWYMYQEKFRGGKGYTGTRPVHRPVGREWHEGTHEGTKATHY